jgi:phosphoglycolate phosphatase
VIKLVIFDLDGTLADTILDIRDGLNGMLYEYGFPLVNKEQTLSYINNGALELVRRSLPKEYQKDEDFVKSAKRVYERYYSQCYNNKTKEYKGCSDALKSLANCGLRLAVLSNKQDEFVKKIVSKLFVDVPFEFVLGQSEKFPTKPDPASIHYIISELGVSAEETVLVGDSNVDMLTAKNADIIPIGVSWGYRPKEVLIELGAIHVLESPSEIAGIISILK